MSNYPLSICIPTKRDLELSKNTISSAIGFCESSKSELVVSDNSSDKKKLDMWNNIKLPFMKYLKEKPHTCKYHKGWVENWANGIDNCSGSFTGILCDDDLILNLGESQIDYSTILSKDIVGIKPLISLWNQEVGIYKINNFNIDAQNASQRIKQYYKNSAGNNSTYFSFFKSDVLKSIFKILKYHPTKGGYLDWAITISLIAEGKIFTDSTKLLIYKNENWFGNNEYLNQKSKLLYTECGLKEKSFLYERFFRALDCFIMIMRQESLLNYREKLEAAEMVFNDNINLFMLKYSKNKSFFSAEENLVIEKINSSFSLKSKLKLFLEILGFQSQELRKKYQIFYKKSLHKDWGRF